MNFSKSNNVSMWIRSSMQLEKLQPHSCKEGCCGNVDLMPGLDCILFPIINYFLVKYHIFTFFSIHVHITTHNMSSYSVGYSLELEHTSCAQCQLKWWMMIMIDDDGDGCWWIMMMDNDDG